MAKIFPNSDRVKVVFPSHAEEQLYQLFRNFSKDWSVYYSCTLSAFEQEQGLVENEIDFVLYHPKLGVVVVEVKGGRITYDPASQQFYSENRYGEQFSIKNPFAQALNWKSRFLRFLKRKDIKVPVSHIVCMPSVNEQEFPSRIDIENGLLIGRERLQHLEDSILHLITQVHPAKFLQFRDVGDELDRLLRGARYTSKLFLKDYIVHQENKVSDVQWMQDSLVNPIAQSKKMAIEGEAGTGKTILASALAKWFRDKGMRVLYLSSNPLLNDYLRPILGKSVEIETYSGFASTYGIEILKRPHDFEGTREDWIQYVGPEKLKASILGSEKRYDVLICDEAQDVQPFWWESIESSLEPILGHFYIFFDRSQGVFGSGSTESGFVPEDVLPIPAPYFPLIHNYRTTKEIASFSRSFRTGRQILVSHTARLGYAPEIISYKDAEDARNRLRELLERLVKQEGLSPEDITLLSARRPFHDQSVLEGIREVGEFGVQEIGSKQSKKAAEKSTFGISTIASFKGLETNVAIVLNLSEYHMPLTNPIMTSLLYVACTRAKHMLFLFVKEGDQKRDILLKALDNVPSKGSLVIGAGQHDHVYTGVVNYFNPDRLGWLTLDEASSQAASVMFLPSDLKSLDISDVKVGARFSFRVKPEGFTSIAVDLKLIPV